LYLYEVVINARNNIFFSFFFFHSQMPPRGAFGLRIAMAPWDCINPYIRLNPSSRKFRCGSTGGPTCDLFSIFFFYFQLDTPHHSRVQIISSSLPAILENFSSLCSRSWGYSCCRLLLLHKCRGSWVYRAVRCLFIHKDIFHRDTMYFVAAQTFLKFVIFI